jgi:hypothetical protein
MTKAEQRKLDRLEALLAAETKRADEAWGHYRESLYKLVDCQLKLKHIAEVMAGDREAS